MLAPLIAALALSGAAPPFELDRVGTLSAGPIREASGLVKSRRHPGLFWTHNDSENSNTIFAVRADGSLVREYTVNALNVDWEDIATDDHGHLYLGDTGNNGNRLPLRVVYQFDEPDPAAAPRKNALKVNLKTYYTFAHGRRFDAEGLVVVGDVAWVVAKTFDGREAEVYSLPLAPPAPLLRPATPAPVGTLPGFTEPVTGADLTADGRLLAVCSTSAVGVYEVGPAGKFRALAVRGYFGTGDVEAIAWDGHDLVLAGEGRGMYRVAEATWRGEKAGETARPKRRAARDAR